MGSLMGSLSATRMRGHRGCKDRELNQTCWQRGTNASQRLHLQAFEREADAGFGDVDVQHGAAHGRALLDHRLGRHDDVPRQLRDVDHPLPQHQI